MRVRPYQQLKQIWLSVLYAFALLLLYSAVVQAQERVPDFVTRAVEIDQQVLPPARKWDWLQLTSGEWLKGDVKVLYSHVLEFDSDELGLLDIDIDDISQLVSSRVHAIRIMGLASPLVGEITLTKNEIIVTAAGQRQSFPRNQLITLVSGRPKEANYWSIRAGAGATLRAGNSPQTEYNGKINIKRRTALSRLLSDYLGIYTRADSEETANNHRLSSSYDIFASDRMFYRPALAEIFSDKFQNIQARGTVGAGLGYALMDTKRTEWDVFFGPGVQFTTFYQVEKGSDKRKKSPVFIATSTLDTELTKSLDLDLSYQILWVDQASGGYTHHALATFSYELTGSIDLDTSFVWDYTQYPTPGENGVAPNSDDYRLLFSIGYEFN